MTPRVQARGVTKRFTRRGRQIDALVDVDLEVDAGELLLASGPSLAGKTTLLHLLAGWMSPDAGVVMWDGAPDPPPWSHLTVVTQAFTLLEELTIEENVTIASRAGTARRGPQDGDPEDGDRLMERLRIAHLARRLPSEVSVGERQRTMVARALFGSPALVLADEPVSHQDDDHADIVLDLLAERAAQGVACVVAGRGDERIRSRSTRELALTAPAAPSRG